MANTKIFASASTGSSRRAPPVADTVNRAGGRAYALSTKAALAQMAVTGVFNDTFYATAKAQLDDVRDLVAKVEPKFIAQLAVYARRNAYMKDLPAYLCAVLAERDVALLASVFDRVIDNGKMLRNFVQMVRSGQAGRRSLGTRPKKLVQRWLQQASDERLLAASVGNSPSLADVMRLAHPKADTPQRDAMFKYLLGRPVEQGALPVNVQALEAFRRGESLVVPKVPFELLTALPLSAADWVTIARNASWTQTRMNLNTFQRHGVFESREMVELVAARLRNPELVAQAKVFPYQLLAAYKHVSDDMPSRIVNALQDAMELAIDNVPQFACDPAVLADVSGSMKDPATGQRVGSTSKMRCVDVAGLFASAVLRRNRDAMVVPFDTRVHKHELNPRDAVVTNAQALAKFGGGGTDCGMALAHLNSISSRSELVIYISDNESWVDSGRTRYGRATSVMDEWTKYKSRVKNAKLVCIDITPNKTTQARERHDILNIGGFSDEVFTIIEQFAKGELGGEHWVGEIERVEV
jgi:60 kDa SS-A/Ro ribonucleoprotein